MKTGFDYLFENTNKLPPEIADVVLNFKFTQGFSTLVNKYKLHLDQAEILEDMTFRVMFSDMTDTEFTAKLVSELGMSPVSAKELTEDTNTNIVAPVKLAIETRIHGMLEDYKDIDDNEIEPMDTEDEEGSIPSPAAFHPNSYNEPITDDNEKHHAVSIGARQNITHSPTIPGSSLTHADILHGIENPHSTLPNMGNSAIKTASGSKSYSDVMAASNPTAYFGAELHSNKKTNNEIVLPPTTKSVPIEKEPTVKITPVAPAAELPIKNPDIFPKPINPTVPSMKPIESNQIIKTAPAVKTPDIISLKSNSIVVTSPAKNTPTVTTPTGFIHNNLAVPDSAHPSVDPYKESF